MVSMSVSDSEVRQPLPQYGVVTLLGVDLFVQPGDLAIVFMHFGQGGYVMHAGRKLARDQKKPAEQREDEHGEWSDERKRETNGLGHLGVRSTQRLEVALDS